MSLRPLLKPSWRERLSAWGWEGLFAIPLCILALLGWRGLQGSRLAVREQSSALGQAQVAVLLARLQARLPRLEEASPGLLVYPEPPAPGEPAEAVALYEEALRLPPAESRARLAALAETVTTETTAAGVPLRPLLEWARLSLAEPAELSAQAERLRVAAISLAPSFLTPELMRRARDLVAERAPEETGLLSRLEHWAAEPRWQQEEQWREALRREGSGRPGAREQAHWLTVAGRQWWVRPLDSSRAGGRWSLTPREEVQELAVAVSRESAARSAPYAQVAVALGEELLTAPALPAAEVLAAGEQGPWRATVRLADPARLFARQQTQSRWLAAVLVVTTGAMLGARWGWARALRRERQLGEQKSDFISSVSHELRAPLASMRLLAENLAAGTVQAEARRHEYYRLLAEEGQRLSALVENVLSLARLERREAPGEMMEIEVAGLVQDALRLAEPRARQREQRLTAELLPLEPPPCGDGAALRQALGNLLDNALKFSPPGATIGVEVRPRPPGQWQMVVHDDGPGIPPAEHERVFARFYRLGSELRRETPGTGLGLALVRQIVEAHGGTIAISAPPGACFTLTLPLAPHAAG